ncbi:MAG: hypothetical protein AAFO91_05990, partial [Bacteroidota bacterium]
LEATTQLATRSATAPIQRRYRTDILSTRHRRLNTTIYSDTFFAKVKSLRGNTCAQLFAAQDFIWIHPMKSKSSAGEALQAFIEAIGIPAVLIVDGAAEQVGTKSTFAKTARHYHCNLRQTEAYSQWQNKAEAAVREVKKRWKARTSTRSVPTRLWDFGMVYEAEILSRTVRTSQDQRTGIERISGDTPDISEWTDFSFYDRVWAWDAPHSETNPVLGRWLGVSHRIGSGLCYWVLKSNGTIMARSTVQHVTADDATPDKGKEKIDEYDKSLTQRLDDTNFTIATDMDDEPTMVVDPEMEFVTPDDFKVQHAIDADEYTDEAYDEYLQADLILPKDNEMVKAKVTKRKRGDDGRLIGARNENPIADTRIYEVEFTDGSVAEYSANVVAENVFAQIDSEGHRFRLVDEITDHKSGHDALRRTGDHKQKKKTTRGWKLEVLWRDGTTDWVPLKDLKDSNPIEVAEYAVANGIDQEPAFAWWVHDTIRRRNRIVSKAKSRYWKTTHKFGLEFPHSVQQALQIDKKTQSDHWKTAIEKEMGNMRKAEVFEQWSGSVDDAQSGKGLVGYQQIECHMIF